MPRRMSLAETFEQPIAPRELYERDLGQLANQFGLSFGGFQRTVANEMSRSEELSEQLRTPANEGERAKFGPTIEVKVRLPDAVAGALENAADILGVSLEALVLEIITRRRGRATDGDSPSAG